MILSEAAERQMKHVRIDAAIQVYEKLLDKLEEVLCKITGSVSKPSEDKRQGEFAPSLAAFLEGAGTKLEELNDRMAQLIAALDSALF